MDLRMRHTLLCVLGIFMLNTHLYGHAKEIKRPVVTLQPNWPKIFSGERITLRCEIKSEGDTEWEYEWRTTSSIKPPNGIVFEILKAHTVHSGDYSCKGKNKTKNSSTKWSNNFKLTVCNCHSQPVLTVSPSWLSPGASVTLSCRVKDPSAGWRFFWFKAVPKLSANYYDQELLPGSSNGTEQDSYIVHGQTHTAGYKCRAGRGDPVYYTDDSIAKFVWSADLKSSASLTVNPDRVQHFSSEPVSLSCEGNSTEWRVMRFTEKGSLLSCNNWGKMIGSTCHMHHLTYTDAVYWCESGSGEFSNAVNITVHLSRPESHSFFMPVFIGILTGVLLIILLLLLYRIIKSKDPCGDRPTQSQSIDQDNRVTQDKTQEQVYSSLLEGDVCVYESIGGCEDSGSAKRPLQEE
ncbi:uncharacterized protein LOC119911487 [Micropterus salmoides]|uniref:uncharacterized protein LOC119911487 n=1 Tax=Micropterus salmoides TaxID=27706 RepID=UPI0018ED44A8|nr:uncharacterized protein LOC119911487 [Micropterus salmoides]